MKCNSNSGKLWKVMNAVTNKKQANHVPKNLEFQGQYLTTDVEITITFNSYLAHLVDQFITNDGLSEFVINFLSLFALNYQWGLVSLSHASLVMP